MIVTEVGSVGSSRDRRTGAGSTLATNNHPLGRMLNPLRVSRKDCLVLLGLHLRSAHPPASPPAGAGVDEIAPGRRESLTDCTNATLGTSTSHARSVVFLALVMTRR
jgi:hypothetical protein